MKALKKLEILPLEESDRGVAAYLLMYSVMDMLDVNVGKIEQAGLAIKNGLIVKKFSKAVSDGKIIGLVSLSNPKSGFMDLEYNEVKKQYGMLRARKVYNALSSVFSILGVPPDGGYITFPISPQCDSEYITTELMKYVIAPERYDRYYTYISPNDGIKRSQLESIGFHESGCFDRRKSPAMDKSDARYVLMEYIAKKT